MAGEAGKGSRPRPYSVDQKTFSDNWDQIFKKEKQDESSKSKPHSSTDTSRSSDPQGTAD